MSTMTQTMQPNLAGPAFSQENHMNIHNTLRKLDDIKQEIMILREHIPESYDNLFQSILSFASRCQSYF